jgi:hypothetical protein
MPKRKKIQIASLIIAGIIILIILSHLLIFLGLNIVLAVGMSFLLTSLTALWLTFIFHAGFDPGPMSI